MQIIIACVGCAKRYVTNDSRLAKELVCPVCGGAMKSAPRLNVKKPTKSHLVEDLPEYPAAALPAPSLKFPKQATDPTKRVLIYGGAAVGLVLVLGIGWIVYSRVSDEKSPTVVWSNDHGPRRESGNSTSADAEGSPPPTTLAPNLAPVAPAATPSASKPQQSPAESVLDKVGSAVVRLTMLDGAGDPRGAGSGAIVARRAIRDWVEKDPLSNGAPAQGDAWLVATTYRTIAGAADIEATLRDGTRRRPRGLVAADPERDLALLAFDDPPKDLLLLEPVAEPGARAGDDLFALGYRGPALEAATGKLEKFELPDDLRDVVRSPTDVRWIRSTAAPERAGCGGPLVTSSGKLAGLTAWSYDDGTKAGARIGVAIAAESVVRFIDSANEEESGRHRLAISPLSTAPPLAATTSIEGRSDWTEAEVRSELERSTKRMLEIDWKPATKGDYVSFQAAGKAAAAAAPRGFAPAEIANIAESVRKRIWDFETQVKPINRLALEGLAAEQWGTVFVGRVRRINPASPRHLAVDLVGRGHTFAVTIPSDVAAPNLKPGDDVLVFGYRYAPAPKGGSLPRDSHEVLAGAVVQITPVSLPPDAELQEAYDLVRLERESAAFGRVARRHADDYERALPLVGKVPIRWQRLGLNQHGRQFDAVRMSVPPGLNCDLLWSFTSPEESIEAWGVMPVGEFAMREEGTPFTSHGQPVSQLTKDESQHVVLQAQTGGSLAAGEDYLLWFAFKDPKPRRVALCVRLVPVGSFDAKNLASTGKAMQDGLPFAPAETARMLQLLKERAAAAAEAKTPKPAAAPSVTPTPSATK